MIEVVIASHIQILVVTVFDSTVVAILRLDFLGESVIVVVVDFDMRDLGLLGVILLVETAVRLLE